MLELLAIVDNRAETFHVLFLFGRKIPLLLGRQTALNGLSVYLIIDLIPEFSGDLTREQ